MEQQQYHGRYHRHSFPSSCVISPPHSTSHLTDGCAEISHPMKDSPLWKRPRKPCQLPKLVGCEAPHDDDDVIPDMTSCDAHESTSDAGDYLVERPSMVSVMRRKLGSAEMHASSPVNKTGVHIVIGNDDDEDNVTSGDDVIVFFGDDKCTSGKDVPSGGTS